MAAGAHVVEARRFCPFAATELVRDTGFHRTERTALRMETRQDRVGLGPVGDDIDDSSHGIGAVIEGRGTADDLYPLRHRSLVVIRYRVTIQTGVLRQTVDEHQHIGVGLSANTAHFDAARTACAHSVAQHTALGDKESRHLFGQGRQDIRLLFLRQYLFGHYVYRHRQQARVSGGTCAGSHHLLQRNRRQRVLCL